MPSCSTAENPKGQKITFIEETHKYSSNIDGKEIVYISGTGFLHNYFPEFDPTGEITKRCAAKAGVSVDEIKAQWKAKGDFACKFGTRVHELCEDIELGRNIRNSPTDEKEQKTFANAKKIAQYFHDKLDILGVEKIVFSVPLKIAGTIDLFARSRKTGEYLIIDHKTNQSIDRENTYNKFCLSPISHLPDLNFYHYALQLNLYQYILQKEGYVGKNEKFKLVLNHITEDNFEIIQLPDLQLEVKDMMIDYLCKLIK